MYRWTQQVCESTRYTHTLTMALTHGDHPAFLMCSPSCCLFGDVWCHGWASWWAEATLGQQPRQVREFTGNLVGSAPGHLFLKVMRCPLQRFRGVRFLQVGESIKASLPAACLLQPQSRRDALATVLVLGFWAGIWGIPFAKRRITIAWAPQGSPISA